MKDSKPSPKSLHPTRYLWSAALAIALLTFLVYSPTLRYGYVNFDDQDVYNSREIRNLDLPLLVWSFTSFQDGNWIPVTWISFAVDYHFWGANPRGYHLQNIVWHSLNVVLAMLLVARLVARYRFVHGLSGSREAGPYELAVAGLTSLLFGIHPLRAESVAWIFERKDVLYAFFFLGSLLLYLSYAEAKGRKKAVVLYLAALAAFALSLMAKPMAVTLPVVLFLLDAITGRRTHVAWNVATVKRTLLEKAPFLIMALGGAVLAVVGQRTIHSLLMVGEYSWKARILNSAYSVWFYIEKTLLPVNISPFYPVHAYAVSPIHASVFFLLIAAVTSYCVFAYRQGRYYWAWAWTYYLVNLAPVMGIVKVGGQGVASRFAYLPTLSILLLISLGTVRIFEKATRSLGLSARVLQVAGLFSILLFAGGLSTVTLPQIRIWREPVALWDKAIEVLRDASPAPYVFRGNAWLDRNDLDRAFLDCNHALELEPVCEKCLMCRAEVYDKTGNNQAALADYNAVLAISPFNSDALNNRGVVYLKLGEISRAEQDFRLRDHLERGDPVR